MQESKNLFLLTLCFLSNFSCSFFPYLFLNQFLSSFLSSFFLSCPSLSVFFLSSLLSFFPLTLSSFLVCFLLYLSIVSVHLFIVSYGQKCSNTRSSICGQHQLFSEDGVAGRRQDINWVFASLFFITGYREHRTI